MSDSVAHRTGRADPSGDIRVRLLDAAAAAFLAEGYAAAETATIAEAAGVTDEERLQRFASKRAMAVALLAERFVREVKSGWIDPVRRAPDLALVLSGVLRRTAAGLDEDHRLHGAPIRHLPLELAMAEADFRSIVDALFEAWREAIAVRLAAEAEPDAEVLAAFAVAAFSGAMALANANQSVGPILAVADQLEERFAKKERPAEAGR